MGTPVRRAWPAVLGTFARTLGAFVAVAVAVPLGGCGNQNPVMTPVGWWHDLQGGEIAATRPPPPGADLPYPKLGSIPPKPILPSNSYRNSVRDALTAQRDDAERLAARRPIDVVVNTPPPPPQAPADPAADTANATLPAADAAPAKAAAPAPVANTVAPPAADGGPALGTAVTLAGAPMDSSELPPVPDAPPAPATFEDVALVPAPTPAPPLPSHSAHVWSGNTVLFATNNAVLDSSQNETLNGVLARRGKGHISIEGHGDAQADTPEAQQAALDLAVKRAQAIAAWYRKKYVPADALRMSATAFGRGASISNTP